MGNYIISIAVPGFTLYEITNIENVLDMGDCYNIMWGNNEIFIDKDKCEVDPYFNNIIYKYGNIEIYIEKEVA